MISFATMSLAEKPILGPSSAALGALRNATFTEAKRLIKPNGQEIVTRLVVEGAGMIGLEDRVENQEWAGIHNHIAKVAGGGLQLGRLLQLNGQDVDLPPVLDTGMLTHLGRRQFDEARWYPEEVDNADWKSRAGDTQITLAYLPSLNFPEMLLEMIRVHALGTLYPYEEIDNWNKKLLIFLDFRISQNAMSLEQRFQELQGQVQLGRLTQEWIDQTKAWAQKTESELFEALFIPSYETATDNPQNLRARINTAIKLGKFSEEEARDLTGTKLYKNSGSDREVAEVAGLTRGEFLDRLQLHPGDINERLLRPERWERYIRRLYVNDAEEAIFARFSELITALRNEDEVGSGVVLQGISDRIDREFPPNSWWGKYVRELYEQRKGHSLNPRSNKPRGIARAIEFYQRMEQDWQNWVNQQPSN